MGHRNSGGGGGASSLEGAVRKCTDDIDDEGGGRVEWVSVLRSGSAKEFILWAGARAGRRTEGEVSSKLRLQ